MPTYFFQLEKLVSAIAAKHDEVELPVELTVNMLVQFAERAAKPDGAEFLQQVDDFARPGMHQHTSWLDPIAETLAAKAKQFVPELFASLTDKQISDILMVMATNAHAFESEKGRFVGLYPLGSKLAHSCAPNALQTFEGTKLVHYVLQDIAPGELITINYGFADDIRSVFPTPLRRNRLEVSKFFVCKCKRCVAPDTNRIMLCPKCGKAAVVKHDFEETEEPREAEEPKSDEAPKTPNELGPAYPYKCLDCSAVFAPSDMPLHAEQELAESVAQLGELLMTPDTDRDALYDAVEKCLSTSDAKLGTEHWISGWSVLLLLSDSRDRPLKKKARATDAAYMARRKELAKRWYRWSRVHIYPYFPHYYARLLCSSLSDMLDEAGWDAMAADPALATLEQYLVPQLVSAVFPASRLKAIKTKIDQARRRLAKK